MSDSGHTSFARAGTRANSLKGEQEDVDSPAARVDETAENVQHKLQGGEPTHAKGK